MKHYNKNGMRLLVVFILSFICQIEFLAQTVPLNQKKSSDLVKIRDNSDDFKKPQKKNLKPALKSDSKKEQESKKNKSVNEKSQDGSFCLDEYDENCLEIGLLCLEILILIADAFHH